MRLWRHQIIAAVTLCLVACSSSPRPKVLATARHWLVKAEPETLGFGMYSYLLFDGPPTNATKALYLAIIRSSLDMIETESRELIVFKPAQLNLFSIPVDAEPPA